MPTKGVISRELLSKGEGELDTAPAQVSQVKYTSTSMLIHTKQEGGAKGDLCHNAWQARVDKER